MEAMEYHLLPERRGSLTGARNRPRDATSRVEVRLFGSSIILRPGRQHSASVGCGGGLGASFNSLVFISLEVEK